MRESDPLTMTNTNSSQVWRYKDILKNVSWVKAWWHDLENKVVQIWRARSHTVVCNVWGTRVTAFSWGNIAGRGRSPNCANCVWSLCSIVLTLIPPPPSLASVHKSTVAAPAAGFPQQSRAEPWAIVPICSSLDSGDSCLKRKARTPVVQS